MKHIFKLHLSFFLLMSVTCMQAQDVVFTCLGSYYAIKSSDWDGALSRLPVDTYFNNLNMETAQLPFEHNWENLDAQVRDIVKLDQQMLILKELLLYKDTVEGMVGELRYKLKVTPYYYLPISIYFNEAGKVNLNNNMLLSMAEALRYDYCDAIKIARSSMEFNTFLLNHTEFEVVNDKTLGAIANVRLCYSKNYDSWIWEVYTSTRFLRNNNAVKFGKLASVDAVSGVLLAVKSYGQLGN